MVILIIVLLLIIIVLITYLFLLKREIRRISGELIDILNIDTNHTLHIEIFDKDVRRLISEINVLVKYIKTKELSINQKNDALKNGITNITHDLRTPLTSSLGYIELLQGNQLTKEEQIKDLQIVKERLLRLSQLINNFFEYSKTISINQHLQLSKINIIDILQERIIFYYEDFNNQDRMINLTGSESKILLLTNTSLLTRVFDNLIFNAFKHCEEDLYISITKNKRLIIKFSNKINGSNLDIDKLFVEFYTADISRTKGDTGLGLVIVKEFTELLGGSVNAYIDNQILSIELIFNT